MSKKTKFRDLNETIVCGMEFGHLVEDAELWWENTGKEMCRNRQYSQDMKTQAEACNAINPLHPNYIGPSGIMAGFDWAALNVDEKRRIVAVYAAQIGAPKNDTTGLIIP